MFFLNFASFLLFFTLDFKVCVDLCKIKKKKSDPTRCLAVSILEYNINWNSKSAERVKAFKNEIHVV